MRKNKNICIRKNHPKWVYYLALVFVIIVWGVDPMINSYFYNYYSASVLSTICTFCSAVFFLVLSAKKLKQLDSNYLKIALPISFLNSFACLLQRIGLQYTTPANYAFLEHLSCVIVPIMMFIFIKKKATAYQIIASVLCLIGCFVLSGIDFRTNSLCFGIGEFLCAAAGILLGVCVAATGVFAKKLDINLYMVIHMFMYFVVSLLMTICLNFITVDGIPMEKIFFTFDITLLLLLLVFGLITIGLCWLLKTEAIRHIDPSIVAVMCPFSAVITGIISVIFGTDQMNINLILGSILIFVAVTLSGLNDAINEKKHNYPDGHPNNTGVKSKSKFKSRLSEKNSDVVNRV